MSEEFGHSLCLSDHGNHGVDQAAGLSRLDWGRVCFCIHSGGCWQGSVPHKQLAGGLSQLFATWASWSSAHKMEAGFLQREKVCPRMKLPSFSNIILEVTSHYFCFVLFSRNKSLNPVLAGGEGDYPWISGEGNHLGEQKWGCLPPTCYVFQVWQSCQRLQMTEKLFV